MVLPEADVRELMKAGEAKIDLESRTVTFNGRDVPFEIDEDPHHRLLNGLDEIGITLQVEDSIAEYERARERTGPVTTSL